jgi:hypothetical protein
MERFDMKDPELHFREMAQLKQVGAPDAYITEFQSIAVTMTDISEQILVMLFTEDLFEPLHGSVKAFKPKTLHDAIIWTWDIEDTVPKTKENLQTAHSPKEQRQEAFSERRCE